MSDFPPVRPFGEWPPIEPQAADTRETAYIPDGSITDEKIASVSPRKLNLIGAMIYDSTTQTITTSGATQYKEFDTAVFDSDGMFDNTNDTLVIPYYGVWVVNATVEFASSAAGNRRGVFLRVNGSDNINSNETPINGSPTQVSIAITNIYAQGTTLGLRVYQDSGGNLDTSAGASNNHLSATYIGDI